MIHYAYTHTRTEASTGYFSCEPHPPLGLGDCLAYLAEHPLDDFMRRHLLNRMAALSAGEAAAAIRRAFPEPPPAVQALIRELALTAPHWRQEEALFAAPPALDPVVRDQATSLPLLRLGDAPGRDAHADWNRAFAANIQGHRALPGPDAIGLPPLYPDIHAHAPGEAGVPASLPARLPGFSPVFTAPFPAHIKQVHAEHAAARAADGSSTAYARAPSGETAALAEERLRAAGIIAGGEMRHTASLSPIGLLRPWNIRISVRHNRHEYTLEGQATTYGRGLTLADARASCLMEMVERASAYLSLAEEGICGLAGPSPLITGTRAALLAAGHTVLDPADYPLEADCPDVPLAWMRGAAAGPEAKSVLLPVQMASLFCNLDEISLFDSPGSTGIATGCTPEEAKLAALLEILERDAEATTPFSKADCFTLRADPETDPLIAALLADYAGRGINVQFQDVTGPMGVPVYSCFVMSPRGAIARGYGAGLSARRALISALTETPFPYPDGGPSGPMLRKLPARTPRELPEYSLDTPARNLAMLEDLLARNHRPPVYADLTRADLAFPVVRAFIPGMELAADNSLFSRVPPRLYAKYLEKFTFEM